jgi:hypothetical protein
MHYAIADTGVFANTYKIGNRQIALKIGIEGCHAYTFIIENVGFAQLRYLYDQFLL